jgi:hypothetical protein
LFKFIARVLFLPGSDLAQEISLCRKAVKSLNPWLSSGLISFFLFLAFVAKKKLKKIKSLLVIIFSLFVSFAFAGLLLKDAVAEYYFNSLLPLIALLIGMMIASINKRLLYWLTAGYLLLLAFQSLNLTNSFGLTKKVAMIERIAQQVGTAPYQLEAAAGCHRYQGYQYLFSHYFKPPAASYMDQYFSWLYPASAVKPDKQVLLKPNFQFTINNL